MQAWYHGTLATNAAPNASGGFSRITIADDIWYPESTNPKLGPRGQTGYYFCRVGGGARTNDPNSDVSARSVPTSVSVLATGSFADAIPGHSQIPGGGNAERAIVVGDGLALERGTISGALTIHFHFPTKLGRFNSSIASRAWVRTTVCK